MRSFRCDPKSSPDERHRHCAVRPLTALGVRRRSSGAEDPGGVVVSWTTHDLLSLDWDRQDIYHDAHQAMNGVLAQVLGTLGYSVKPFGTGGASIVTGHRVRDEGMGR